MTPSYGWKIIEIVKICFSLALFVPFLMCKSLAFYCVELPFSKLTGTEKITSVATQEKTSFYESSQIDFYNNGRITKTNFLMPAKYAGGGVDYSYNALGKIEYANFHKGYGGYPDAHLRYKYDSGGRVVEVSDTNNNSPRRVATCNYSGNIIEENEDGDLDFKARKFEFTLDKNGHIIGYKVYDDRNRLSGEYLILWNGDRLSKFITMPDKDDPTGEYRIEDYNEFGWPVREYFGDSVKSAYQNQTITALYEYVTDDHGNWIEKREISPGSNGQRILRITTRKINYK